MAIRWREDGRLLCAAKTKAKVGDTYIDDRLHHQLCAISKAIIADPEHEKNNLWYWIHQKNQGNWLRGKPE